MKQIYIIGMGPGKYEQMTVEAIKKIEESDVVIGYTVYTDLIKEIWPDKECLSTPMTKEYERCVIAFEEAMKGKTVAFVCSGDAGVYGLTGLMLGISPKYKEVRVSTVAGVTAALSGAAIIGAPLIHDFAIISLSDLLTPWEKIEKRLECAAIGDFCICLYNPGSKKRVDYLQKACEILLKHKDKNTPCAIAKNIGREGEEYSIYSLLELKDVKVGMFETVFIGNSMTKVIEGKLVTPRGYTNE
jgi:precorrin-3B C(17)-methyltransferase|nr:precorrin-3B C(17)-methyltransferase [uncultured Lachnoanaerobaculum sp.]